MSLWCSLFISPVQPYEEYLTILPGVNAVLQNHVLLIIHNILTDIKQAETFFRHARYYIWISKNMTIFLNQILTFIFCLSVFIADVFCVLIKFGKGTWSHYHSGRMASHREVQSHCARIAGSLGSITSKCKVEVLKALFPSDSSEMYMGKWQEANTPHWHVYLFLFWQRYF